MSGATKVRPSFVTLGVVVGLAAVLSAVTGRQTDTGTPAHTPSAHPSGMVVVKYEVTVKQPAVLAGRATVTITRIPAAAKPHQLNPNTDRCEGVDGPCWTVEQAAEPGSPLALTATLRGSYVWTSRHFLFCEIF